MYEHNKEKGSVWVTLKRCNRLSPFIFSIYPLQKNFNPSKQFITAPLASKAKLNKMKTAGEVMEYRCLVRATDGKKTISTSVSFLWLGYNLFGGSDLKSSFWI